MNIGNNFGGTWANGIVNLIISHIILKEYNLIPCTGCH
jgi:hypothetical protein